MKPLVCFTADLNISDARGRRIVVEPTPTERMVSLPFVKSLTSKTVAHAGSLSFLKLDEYPYAPTSLFFQAVHHCFANHYALALKPEVMMHLVLNEIATVVKAHPEEYRRLFTVAAEKTRITVRHDGLRKGDPDSPWNEAIEFFRPALLERVPSDVMPLMLPEFSTHTVVSEVASLVSFMDAASPYYDYRVFTKCGIPKISLLGEEDDYIKLLESVKALAPLFKNHLEKYFAHLVPVLETIVAQVCGATVDEDFWKSAYKYESSSGSSTFNGWLSAFVCHIQKNNQLVEKPAETFDWKNCENPGSWRYLTGLTLGCVPSQVSTVPFIWDYFGTEIEMTFAGGVLAIDNIDGCVTPGLSYAVLNG